ncbi:MAG: patatin-like phospholipase family protein [candidate division WOR-3 bacterium]|nr:MAG: patatin-like phospholipase family protein [candidate division WOR-3 bacterium]
MKPFRRHVAVSIDGGGIRGVMVTRALAMLEDHLGKSVHDIFRLATGTSTGSIISAGIGAGLTGAQMYELYCELGGTVFRKTWRSLFWPLTRYRYSHKPLASALKQYIGEITMGDFWSKDPRTDVVITVFDLVDKRTRFVKPWKDEYAGWPVVKAVLASSSIPTYFPTVEGRYVDGGVGSYANPCYLAAYEIRFCLEWDSVETTLISLGTGREPHTLRQGEADNFWAWNWISPILGAFLQSADDQQVHLVKTFFEKLDFRRFQVDLREPIKSDDPREIPKLSKYGEELGRKILNDETDRQALEVKATRAPRAL